MVGALLTRSTTWSKSAGVSEATTASYLITSSVTFWSLNQASICMNQYSMLPVVCSTEKLIRLCVGLCCPVGGGCCVLIVFAFEGPSPSDILFRRTQFIFPNTLNTRFWQVNYFTVEGHHFGNKCLVGVFHKRRLKLTE